MTSRCVPGQCLRLGWGAALAATWFLACAPPGFATGERVTRTSCVIEKKNLITNLELTFDPDTEVPRFFKIQVAYSDRDNGRARREGGESTGFHWEVETDKLRFPWHSETKIVPLLVIDDKTPNQLTELVMSPDFFCQPRFTGDLCLATFDFKITTRRSKFLVEHAGGVTIEKLEIKLPERRKELEEHLDFIPSRDCPERAGEEAPRVGIYDAVHLQLTDGKLPKSSVPLNAVVGRSELRREEGKVLTEEDLSPPGDNLIADSIRKKIRKYLATTSEIRVFEREIAGPK